MSAAPLRVLMVTPDFPPARGGIQTLMGKLSGHLPGAQVEVVTLAAAEDATCLEEPGVDVRRVRLAARVAQARIATLTARALLEGLRFRPTVTLAGHVAVFGAVMGIRRLTGAPAVLYVHAEEFRVWPRRTRHGVRGADAVIAVSRHAEHMALGAGAPRERMYRILHGVDLPPCPPAIADRPADPPTVLTVARLSQAHKGHDVMLEAIARLRPRVPGVRWVVIGDGPLRAAYEQRARHLGLGDAVAFLGSVSDAERDRWLDRAHVFAMPSRLPDSGVGGEGFGIVYLEAAAHRLPVVAAREGGAVDAVDGERSAVLVDPRDPTAVAAALERLLLDRDLAGRLGQAGYEWARRRSWRATGAQVAGVLQAVSR